MQSNFRTALKVAKYSLGTLLTLIVVAAFLFPYFAKARIGGGSDRCKRNLSKMWRASLVYGEDNNEYFPSGNWMDGLKDYGANESDFHDSTAFGKPNYGYAFRSRALNCPRSAVEGPSKFVLIFDSVLEGRNRSSELWSLPQEGRHPGSADFKPLYDNVLCADGHAHSPRIDKSSGSPAPPSQLESMLEEDDRIPMSLIKR